MLQLAKTESKKEMSLKRRKKLNTARINNNYINLTSRNIFSPNNNLPNNRIKHKIVKKSQILTHNSSPKNKNKNNIPKNNSDLSFINSKKSQKKSNLVSSQSNVSPMSCNDKNKKIIVPKNNSVCTSPKKSKQCQCQSLRNKNFSENNRNNDFGFILNFQKEKRLDTEESNILKTAENDRMRKLISMSSNIFNLNETATNLYRRANLSPQNPNLYKILSKKDNKNIISNNLNTFFDINKNKNSQKKNGNNYNRINILNRTEYNPNETNSLYSNGKKTNRANIESVKYDIITTKKSSLYDKYKDLSGVPASCPKVEDYDIVIPKNYNKANLNQIKGLLSSNGVHYFNVKEEGDLIGGQKGKFKMKVRLNGQNDINNNRMINKTSQKLSKCDVKLKKKLNEYGKKRTDITGYGWDETIANGLK